MQNAEAQMVNPFKAILALALAGPAAVVVWSINSGILHMFVPVYWCSVVSPSGGSEYCWPTVAHIADWVIGIAISGFAIGAAGMAITWGFDNGKNLLKSWPANVRWIAMIPLAIIAVVAVLAVDIGASLLFGVLPFHLYPLWLEKLVQSATMPMAFVLIAGLVAPPSSRNIVAAVTATIWCCACVGLALFGFSRNGFVSASDPMWLVVGSLVLNVFGAIVGAALVRTLIKTDNRTTSD
jgi:hypothetical protein